MRISRCVLASMLIGLMACLPLMGTDGAMLSPMAGTVQVNGQPALAGSAVIAGDRVSISGDGSAQLTLRGASVVAAAKTVFRLQRNAIQLDFGMVQIAGSLPVISNGRVVTPMAAGSRYAVIALNGPLYVEALVGNIKVRAYQRNFTVPAGTAMKFQDANAAGQAATPDQTQTQTQQTPDQTQTQQQTATPDQTQTQQQTTPPADQTQQPAPAPEQQPAPPPEQQPAPAAEQQPAPAPAPAEQNPPAAGGQQTTTTTEQGAQTTTTTTETTVQTEQGAAAGGGGLSVPLTLALAAAAAVITGVIVHQATKCDNCIVSPSQ